ncbi:MAG: ATP-binding protein [Gemmiger sp.]
MKYKIECGVVPAPVKIVLYGPEGIGKSTFASQFPDPVFIDTEGGTKRLNVARLPAPTSWSMLMDEVAEVARGNVPCGTLVIDTADWAERLCIDAVCARFKVNGIEDFGYGKGYTYAKEEFARLLDALEEVLGAGKHVVVTAHAQITRFDQPDAVGSYDRWAMKTSKQVAPLLREWCDMLLFANYKTIVEKAGPEKNAKNKASGGKRMLYTTHNSCWDAKNRFGLPDEVPFEFASIAGCITPANPNQGRTMAPSASPSAATAAPGRTSTAKPSAPATARVERTIMVEDEPPAAPAPDPAVQHVQAEAQRTITAELNELGYPAALRDLMAANHVDDRMLRHAVFQRGCYPEDMEVRSYDPELIANIVAKWEKWLEFIRENSDIPF